MNGLEQEMIRLVNQQTKIIEENSRIQSELVEEKEKAEESNELKTTLLSNLSHEFRTPMNGILGFAELLKDNLQENELSLMAGNILRSGKRLLSTLNSILFLSELESGKAKCDLQTLHVNSFILSNLGEYESRAAEKNIYIKTRFKDWKLCMQADHTLLRIAFQHLLDNAIKFTERGGIMIETGKMLLDNKDHVCLSLQDTGIGIESDHLEKIFEPYKQISEGWGRFYEGTGLGLPICRQIISVLHGKIQIESKPEEGSSFTLILPAVEYHENHIAQSPWASIHENMDKGVKPSVTGMPYVLIVEDNSVNKELMVVFLKKTCQTEYASNGETAVKMAASKQYSAILMDINLGTGIDGLEATRQIRQLPGYQYIPIIAVTGYTLSGDKERLMDGGCSHYLPKPFDRTTIVNLVEDVLYTAYSN